MMLPAMALPQVFEGRKFAVKPNANKKVVAEKNQVAQPNEGGFNWSSIISTFIQMLFGTTNSIDKIDDGTNNQGLLGPLLASFLGGQDKGDMAALAKQAGNLIQLLSSLLEALKVSFSQRSSNARSLGGKDAFSDSALASVTIMKVIHFFNDLNRLNRTVLDLQGCVNTHTTEDEICKQRIMCDANRECSRDAPDSGYLFCQLAT